MLKVSAGAVALLTLAGCNHDMAETRYARHAEVRDCVATIEVFAPNAPPPQPYRVLAPVDSGFVGNWGWNSTSRFNKMKKRACELGADAIIDAEDSVASARVTTTYQYDAAGRPVSVVEEAPRARRSSTALAIQFVGSGWAPQQVASAPPQAPMVVVPPPPQVVVVPPPQQVIVVQ